MDIEPEASGLILQIFLLKKDIDLNFYLLFFVFISLIILSGLASGSEGAIFNISEKDKEKLYKSKKFVDKKLVGLIQNPKSTLGTILIMNNFINISIIILFTITINPYFSFFTSKLLSFFIEVVSITIILVVFGELIPKLIAIQTNVAFSRFIAIPLSFLSNIVKPLNFSLIKFSKIVEKRLVKKDTRFSEEEIKQAIDLTSNQGHLAEDKSILKRIVTFGNVSAKQVMTPRVNVVAFNKTLNFSDLVNEVKLNKFSRIPVYDDIPDNIIGILYIRDLLPYSGIKDFPNWTRLLKKAYFVPETKKIDDLLREFQTKKVHMAIVIDEFGGFSGIVTLEDVLEEIVGEISDEFDEPEASLIKKIDNNTYLINASVSLSDLAKKLNISEKVFDEVSGEVETLAGLVVEILGSIPQKGKIIKFGEFDIEVMAAEEKKVIEVKVKIKSQSKNSE